METDPAKLDLSQRVCMFRGVDENEKKVSNKYNQDLFQCILRAHLTKRIMPASWSPNLLHHLPCCKDLVQQLFIGEDRLQRKETLSAERSAW